MEMDNYDYLMSQIRDNFVKFYLDKILEIVDRLHPLEAVCDVKAIRDLMEMKWEQVKKEYI